MDDRTTASRTEFIELIGRMVEDQGMPRIGGRILGLLVYEGRPFSFSELASALDVSRGSISTNTRALVERGAIERCTVPGERQDYFRIGEDVHAGLIGGLIRRMRKTSEDIRRIAGEVPPTDAARHRMQRFADFYAAIGEGLEYGARKVGMETE